MMILLPKLNHWSEKQMICANKKIKKFVEINRRSDGQIAEGVYIAIQTRISDSQLINFWLGTKECGPMLGYNEYYNMWTPLYSRGNYGENYACGGNWSSHAVSLLNTRRLGKKGYWHGKDKVSNNNPGDKEHCMICDDGQLLMLPEQVKISNPDIKAIDIDCSVGWTIFFPSASDALEDMLVLSEIQISSLPTKTKALLQTGMYNIVRQRLLDLVKTFNL